MPRESFILRRKPSRATKKGMGRRQEVCLLCHEGLLLISLMGNEAGTVPYLKGAALE